MTSQQLELITRRGLTLPEPTLTRLRTVGIWCEANLTVQRTSATSEQIVLCRAAGLLIGVVQICRCRRTTPNRRLRRFRSCNDGDGGPFLQWPPFTL
jgi:hypothetical protein